MKQLFDFVPGVFFVITLFVFDIYTATAVLMISITLQLVILKLLQKSITKLQWFAFVTIIGFGTATLILRDPDFIKWKPTIINWVFAVVLLIGPKIFKRNFIQEMMQEQITLHLDVWKKLNYLWALFFGVIGVLNILIAKNFPEKIWAIFKVFGILGLMILFVVAQSIYLSRFIENKSDEKSVEQ